jgi:type II secretory pathway component GspD/PulD (secretin)
MARKNNGRILSGGLIVACTVLLCTLNVSAQIQGQRITFTISGSVGVPNVVMKGLPGDPVSDPGGYYTATVDWGWSGTVRPELEGYTFNPPTQSYSNVTSNQQQDYTASPITYTIAGSVGMEGVRMSGLQGEPVTGPDGTYSVSVPHGWQGVVRPVKEGFEFTPAQKAYESVKRDYPKEVYTAKPVRITISGSAQVEGVTMQGFPTNVVTGPDGTYSTTVEWNWSGTVIPKKDGYTFIPEQVPYSNLTFDQTGQDYSATAITFEISGTATMAGVEMKGFPNPVYTDQSGYYSATVNWGWSGTVTPLLNGYTFKPASQSYSKVDSNRENQNYEATMKTFTISGSTGIDGVTLYGLPDNPVSGPGGSYSVTVDWNWSGTVTPTKEGYEFTPENKPYTSVNADMLNQNYTFKKQTFPISGNAGVAGVALLGAPGVPVMSGSDGSYTINVEYGWSGTITPKKDGYEFSPPNMQYSDVRNAETNQSYMATILKETISGTIRTDTGPVEGILIVSDLGLTTTTDASGSYSLQVDYGWSGLVTPSHEGHTFRPPNQRYSHIIRDMPNQNYQAIPEMFTISDVVSMAGTPIPGVTITATGLPSSTTTNNKGEFSIKVPYGWTGEIKLEKGGYMFNPSSVPYTNVTQNYNKQVPVPKEQPPMPQITPGQPQQGQRPAGGLPQEIKPAGQGGLPQEIKPPTGGLPAEANQPTTSPEYQKLMEEINKLKQARGPVTTAGAPGYDPGLTPITDTFDGEDILNVLSSLGATARIPIIPEGSVYGSVYGSFNNTPLDTALQVILAGTPYVVKKTPLYYLVAPADFNSPLFPKISETRPVKLNYIKGINAVSMLNNVYQPYVKADPTDPNSHTVLITAAPEIMDNIIDALNQLDRTPNHVMLDAKIVVLERGDLLNLGVEWKWPTMRTGFFANNLYGRGLGSTAGLTDFGGDWPYGVQIGYAPDATFTDSLEMALNLLVANDEAKIMSKPQLVALDGRQARIRIIKEEYYVLSSPQVTSFGFSTNYLQDIQSGTTLTITPYIGSDNKEITLEIAVEVSDSVPTSQATTSAVAGVIRRTAENIVRVDDGGTAIVAGLKEDRNTTMHRRVPGLSNIPLVGELFKNKNDSNISREVAFLITARIVPTNGSMSTNMGVGYTEPSTSSLLQQMQQQSQMQSPQFQQPQYQQPQFQQPQFQNQYETPPQGMGNDFQSDLFQSLSRQPR